MYINDGVAFHCWFVKKKTWICQRMIARRGMVTG